MVKYFAQKFNPFCLIHGLWISMDTHCDPWTSIPIVQWSITHATHSGPSSSYLDVLTHTAPWAHSGPWVHHFNIWHPSLPKSRLPWQANSTGTPLPINAQISNPFSCELLNVISPNGITQMQNCKKMSKSNIFVPCSNLHVYIYLHIHVYIYIQTYIYLPENVNTIKKNS